MPREWHLGKVNGKSRLADAPDTGGDVEQILYVNRVAEEPGKDSSAASTEPESTGEICPTVTCEKIGWWIFYRYISGRNVWLLPWLVIKQEQQAENVNCPNRSKQASCLLVFGCTERTTDRERPEEQIAEGSPSLQSTEIW